MDFGYARLRLVFVRTRVAYLTDLFASADKPSDAKEEEVAPANE